MIDEHGKTLEGTGRPPTSGFAIHTRIHLLHPAAKVVLHLHAPYSTALTAIQGGRLQMIHQNAARFFGDIAYDDHFNGIAEATLEGERMAAAMGDRKILFLANHGVVVVGPTVAQALDDFYGYYIELRCQVQVPTIPMVSQGSWWPAWRCLGNALAIHPLRRQCRPGSSAGSSWRRRGSERTSRSLCQPAASVGVARSLI